MPGEPLPDSGLVEHNLPRNLDRQASEPTIGELFTDLTSDLTTLVRKQSPKPLRASPR